MGLPSSRKTGRRRAGRVWVWVLVIIGTLALGMGGGIAASFVFAGYLVAAFGTARPQAMTPAPTEETSQQLYTCGMHPNVIQEGPGECPICHMKLTPLKQTGEEGGAAQAGPRERKILYWRAPMDPGYISDSPGKSPMGMDLVPVYADETQSAAGKMIMIDPVTVQNMGIRTTTVERGPLVKTIRTVGRVDYDEQTVTFIDTKFEGWIETLHVDETGVLVEKGEPLFEVYSPKLYSAQEEYLAALRGVERLADSTLAEAREQAQRLVEAAEVQLRYFDVSEEQIDELRRTREIRKTLTIYSPARGVVTEKMALEGMQVKPGMRLFTIADLSRIWVYVDVYEYQLPWVRVGQRATMALPYIPGEEFAGRVVYVYPYLEKQTRVVKVRLEFENPTLELKPDMYANVMLYADLDRNALLIPREAYIDSGTRKVAFVARGNGKYQPRDIQVGVEAEYGMVEVVYGLDEGERVVTSGQFMLDAESKLKEAIAKMLEAKKPPAANATQPTLHEMAPDHEAHDEMPAGAHPGVGRSGGIPADARYACPMETHPDESDPARQGAFFSAEPGRCDWCGMTLKPLDELEWVRARRAAGESDVAYTCPDHPHVFSEQAGECPRCGRELEPFKVMYTCPDPEHGDVISTAAGACPRCGQDLAPFRGIWLSPEMADENAPPKPEVAQRAAYRCPVHPLAHSDQPGRCPICAAELKPASELAERTGAPRRSIPPDATYVCPMEECWHFSTEPGECPECGMNVKPIEEVDWAKALRDQQRAAAGELRYVCPMHPDQVSADERGTCPICGMRLVAADAVPQPTSAPAAIATQMNYLMEHYLELQKRFAADRTAEVPLHALGLVGAADAILRQLDDPTVKLAPEFADAVRKLRAAAVKTTGKDLEADRVTFVKLGAAMRTLVEHVRPDKDRYPKIYLFHCPMTKGDWLQTSEEIANPFYGFKMLKCGELQATK